MYFITPNYSVAFNAKVGSSTISRAIVAAFHPTQENLIQTAAYPEGRGPDNTQVHWLCPKEKTPSKPVVLIVRDPVDRFRSAMAQTGLTDVDAVLNALDQDGEFQFLRSKRKLREDVHFRHQHALLRGGTAFSLEDLDAAATFIGLTLPLPTINEAKRAKPDLTAEQEAAVRAYYAADQSLFDGLEVLPPQDDPQP